jgi:ubiquinone/menaquinone biosynthesis C-methylase UbiE
VEPIGSFRRFIRKKAEKEKYRNVFPMDGFLDSIPLPDNSLDILFTSNAIGWSLEKELPEIERVVKTGGEAIHLVRMVGDKVENTFHDILISAKWNYKCTKGQDKTGLKIRYHKSIR